MIHNTEQDDGMDDYITSLLLDLFRLVSIFLIILFLIFVILAVFFCLLPCGGTLLAFWSELLQT